MDSPFKGRVSLIAFVCDYAIIEIKILAKFNVQHVKRMFTIYIKYGSCCETNVFGGRRQWSISNAGTCAGTAELYLIFDNVKLISNNTVCASTHFYIIGRECRRYYS